MPNLPKKVAVYVDGSAISEMTKMCLFPQDILAHTAETYRSYNDLDFSYDLDVLPILNWHHGIHLAMEALKLAVSGKNEKDCYDPAIQALAVEAENMYKKISADVAVFFTGLLPAGNGAAPYSFLTAGTGDGAIVIGVGGELFRKENESFLSRFKFISRRQEFHLQNVFLRKVSAVCAHEQGHLFGLGHSELEYSIMHSKSSENQRSFDFKSLEILRKKLGHATSASPL